MVISTAPAVAGNWPGAGEEENFELVAFFGQVNTRVIGKVSKGDYIIASGNNDGLGRAIHPKDLTPEMRVSVVGRAWDDSSKRQEKLINTAVGFAFGAYNLTQDMDVIYEMESTIEDLESDRESLLKDYDERFDVEDEI